MARPSPLTLTTTLLSLLLLMLRAPSLLANADDTTAIQLVTDALQDWPPASIAMSLSDADQLEGGDEVEPDGAAIGRRSLFWHAIVRYYISYGALAANRIPCPPRSGRSYYTHNCFHASGPVHPYTRGCSVITRCRR